MKNSHLRYIASGTVISLPVEHGSVYWTTSPKNTGKSLDINTNGDRVQVWDVGDGVYHKQLINQLPPIWAQLKSNGCHGAVAAVRFFRRFSVAPSSPLLRRTK